MKLLLAGLILCAATAAQAQSCVARVNRQELIVVPEAMNAPSAGLRERMTMWPSRTWSRAWGERVDCDSATVTAFLATTMRLDQTEGYCLAAAPDEEGFLLVPGQANFRGRCRATVCDGVSLVAGQAAGVSLAIAGLVAGRRIDDTEDGVAAVAHGTGAMLVTGQAPAVAASLGQAAGTVGTALATPVVAGAAAVTVMAVGGAVYLCRE